MEIRPEGRERVFDGELEVPVYVFSAADTGHESARVGWAQAANHFRRSPQCAAISLGRRSGDVHTETFPLCRRGISPPGVLRHADLRPIHQRGHADDAFGAF